MKSNEQQERKRKLRNIFILWVIGLTILCGGQYIIAVNAIDRVIQATNKQITEAIVYS